jgi:hypothetical protein
MVSNQRAGDYELILREVFLRDPVFVNRLDRLGP